MISYTITAPLANGTTYQRTESGSNSFDRSSENYVEGYVSDGAFITNVTIARFANANGNGAGTTIINADGGQSVHRSNSGSGVEANVWRGEHQGTISNSGSQSATGTSSPEGFFTDKNQNAGGESYLLYNGWPDLYPLETYSRSQINSQAGHIMAYLTAAPEGGGAGSPIQGANGTNTYSEARYFNTIALQTTTKTTVTNYGKITTTTKGKLAKIGTTITQQIGTAVVTLPTTTNAKSWTENSTTATSATETISAITTSRGIDSYWKKTAYTVYILGKGETAAFLKSNAALNATNGGPTDTKAYDTYSGPTTFTITRAAGTTSQKPVVADTATDIGFEAEEGQQSTVTRSWIAAANSEGVYYYPGWPHHFPLSSSNITFQTGVTESTSTQLGYKNGTGQWGANAPTTTRSDWGQTSVTYSLAGVSFTEGVWTYTENTYAQPIVRSGSSDATTSFGGSDDTESPWWHNGGILTIGGNEGNSGAFGEQANYFVNFQNEGRQNNGGGVDAFYGLAYAWGTLGGTTAEPHQSISVNGINSSESITWPFVSISAGVATPKPFVTVSQIPATSETSSTAATKTEITTRRIWGEEFAKTTSSQNSSTGTSGSTTTPIVAGGAAITSFQLGGARGFPISQLANGWIPAPAMFVIGGIAQTNDSTAIIPPGEYANSTITAPQSFSGSSIANSYFEPKAARTFICSPS